MSTTGTPADYDYTYELSDRHRAEWVCRCSVNVGSGVTVLEFVPAVRVLHRDRLYVVGGGNEDTEGPFDEETTLNPYDEEVRLVPVLHQVENEGGTEDEVSDTPLRKCEMTRDSAPRQQAAKAALCAPLCFYSCRWQLLYAHYYLRNSARFREKMTCPSLKRLG